MYCGLHPGEFCKLQENVVEFSSYDKSYYLEGSTIELKEESHQAYIQAVKNSTSAKRLTVNEAVKKGVVGPKLHHKLLSAVVGPKLHHKLLSAEHDKDPYTGEQISLFQAMKKDVIVRDHGICLLEAQIVADKAAKGGELVYTDTPFGKFQGKTVTIWEIINSEYFTVKQRQDLIWQFRTGHITVKKDHQDWVWLEEAGQNLSIYEALKKDLLQPDVAVALLETQAGTGHIIDPATSA
ncbi:hypothetical protein A6R68_17426 [Neotoma lepida]|uniref:Uncharacterized protein n=1 Tax=Neotoma lepida TaxID=56216 RepID=A0A1A6HCW8_NEOLE|nr:hypothetical protein A6R68_17426 [Neotoma lepida]